MLKRLASRLTFTVSGGITKGIGFAGGGFLETGTGQVHAELPLRLADGAVGDFFHWKNPRLPLEIQVTVRSGARQRQHETIFENLIYQKPVGLDVAFAESFPIVVKRVVTILWRQRLSRREKIDDAP